MSDDTVTVPRELLREVLASAWDDSYVAEYDTKRNRGDETVHIRDRARINELRRAAGMEEER